MPRTGTATFPFCDNKTSLAHLLITSPSSHSTVGWQLFPSSAAAAASSLLAAPKRQWGVPRLLSYPKMALGFPGYRPFPLFPPPSLPRLAIASAHWPLCCDAFDHVFCVVLLRASILHTPFYLSRSSHFHVNVRSCEEWIQKQMKIRLRYSKYYL
jgi:hypothetical protein